MFSLQQPVPFGSCSPSTWILFDQWPLPSLILLEVGCSASPAFVFSLAVHPWEQQREHWWCSTGVYQPIVSEGHCTSKKGDAQANKWGWMAISAAADLQWRIGDNADLRSTKPNFLQACTDHTQRPFQCKLQQVSAVQQRVPLWNSRNLSVSIHIFLPRFARAEWQEPGFSLVIFRVMYWAIGS